MEGQRIALGDANYRVTGLCIYYTVLFIVLLERALFTCKVCCETVHRGSPAAASYTYKELNTSFSYLAARDLVHCTG